MLVLHHRHHRPLSYHRHHRPLYSTQLPPPSTPPPSVGDIANAQGPFAGVLNETNSTIRSNSAPAHAVDVEVTNFALQTVLHAPSPTGTDWSQGVIFRHDATNEDFYALLLNSNGQWNHFVRRNGLGRRVGSAFSSNIKITAGARNKLEIIANGPEGWLFVNNHFVTYLDLSAITHSGDIVVALNFFQDEGTPGQSMEFSHTYISPISEVFSQREGTINNDDPEAVGTYPTNTDLAVGVVDLNFVNPSSATWEYGISFRKNETDNSFFVFLLNSLGKWEFTQRQNAQHSVLDKGGARYFKTAPNQTNRVSIVFAEKAASVWVNGGYVTALSFHSLSGTENKVALTTAYYTNSQPTGVGVNFRDLYIYRAR